MKKLSVIVVLVVCTLASIWSVVNWKYIESFPKIISAYYAKEFCSCYYVMEQDIEYCHNYTRQYVPISAFQLKQKEKRVIVSGLGHRTSALFTGSRHGCVLENK